MDFSKEELKRLALQLQHPKGDEGIEIGENMSLHNHSMTIHSIKELRIRPKDRILELGHGNAKHLAALLKRHPDVTYYGLEISETMCREASQNNRMQIENGKAFFQQYAGHAIPFPDHHFSKIFTVNTIYFWENPVALLQEIDRVLQPGGRCCITYADADFMRKLPFTTFGFVLYDHRKLSEIVKKTSFNSLCFAKSSDDTISKTGESVHRTFTTCVLEKE